MPANLNLSPDADNAFGVALLAGRLVGTVVGSTGHITVRATPKAKVDGRWRQMNYSDATHVFLDVPSPDGDFADKIGTYYPMHAPKYGGTLWTDRNQTDDRRVKAATYLLRVAAGELEPKHVLKSEFCYRCGKELTHPDSIESGFGPECVKKVASFMENRSGTAAGAHQTKERTTPKSEIEPAPALAEVLTGLSDDELTTAMASADRRGDDVRKTQYVNELARRQAEARKLPLQAPAQEFEPPKPTAEAVATTIVAVLSKRDDAREVLAAINSKL